MQEMKNFCAGHCFPIRDLGSIKETFVKLIRFSLLEDWERGLNESVEKGNFMTTIPFLHDNIE